jgi:hypothetical protein
MSQAYNACSARDRARDSTLICRLYLVQHVGRFERRDGRVPALVAMYASRTRERLIHRIAREQSEADGDLRIDAHKCEPARRLASDEIKVRRVPTDNGAKRDERIVSATR